MSVAWFVDGAYLFKVWQNLHRADYMDYTRLRNTLEQAFCERATNQKIEDAYYFNSDPDPPTAKMNSFHNALAYPPPNGPGLRVKLYWLQRKQLYWPAKMGGGPVLHPTSHEQYELIQQKGVDVGLAWNLIRSYQQRKWRTLILAAGDGDFHEPVQHLVENENVRLVLVGSMATISEELRPYARDFFLLENEAGKIARPKPPTI